MAISDYDYNKGGYGKFGIKREYLAEVRTRTLAPDGRTVVRGEAGKQLLRRKQEKQAYYERNNKNG